MKRSFMTTMPDKTGAFLEATRIILAHGGNMTRASYNNNSALTMCSRSISCVIDATICCNRRLPITA